MFVELHSVQLLKVVNKILLKLVINEIYTWVFIEVGPPGTCEAHWYIIIIAVIRKSKPTKLTSN